MTTHTLDQQRAALAWQYAKSGMGTPYAKEYKGLAKGAPALIMNSGLMPTLAFYNGKKKDKPLDKAAQQLMNDLMLGLVQRLKLQPAPRDFNSFMQTLQQCESRDYLRYTDEALELLKWVRQFVDAVETGERA